MSKPNSMVETIEEQIVLIHARNTQYDYVQGMLAVASIASLISGDDRARLHIAAKDALAGYASELDFYADAMARRIENDNAMFSVEIDPDYIVPDCPDFNLLQGRKANDLATLEYNHV